MAKQKSLQPVYMTRAALRTELWSMLNDDARKAMSNIKESYLNSIMADINSYVQWLSADCDLKKIINKKK